MSEMGVWQKEQKLILHNLRGKMEPLIPIKERADGPPIPTEPVPQVRPVEEKPQFDAEEQEIPIISSIEGEKRAELDEENMIHVWCLPAYFRQYKDDMYDETVSRVRYGEKFLFEAVLGDMGDMHLILFTTTEAVTEGSVLFPKTHDKRWWRVMETEKGDDGLIQVYATFTDYHPEFS